MRTKQNSSGQGLGEGGEGTGINLLILGRAYVGDANLRALHRGIMARQWVAMTQRPSLHAERRDRGLRLLEGGLTQAEVARRLGVTRTSVHRWAKRLSEAGGVVEQARARRYGRPGKLNPEKLESLRSILLEGSIAAGFPTEMWTIERARALIEQRFAVSYSSTGCWRVLRELGFAPKTCPQPSSGLARTGA